MSDYIDKVDIEGTQYDIQDTPTKEQAEENAQRIEELENLDIYSLEEIQTAGRWINNKPIYRKVFNMGSLADVTQKEIDISALNVEIAVKIDFMAIAPNKFQWTKPVLTQTLGTGANMFVNFQTKKLVYISNTALNEYTQSYVVFEYTKTTD